MQIDDLTAKLEIVSSRMLQQGEKIQSLQQELLSITEIQKKYEDLQNENNELKELLNLRSQMATNMVEKSEAEQQKRDTEERARQDVVETLKEIDLLLEVHLLFFNVPYFISLPITFLIYTLYVIPLLPFTAVVFFIF